MQATLTNAILQSEIAARIPAKIFLVVKTLNPFRIPNPPNFSSTAARNMEPNTGASTWALGSHICKNKIGSLTKKANRRPVETQKKGPLLKEAFA